MRFNEYVILLIINIVFVLLLNLSDYKYSVMLEAKSFFENHVYTILPPTMQLAVSYFVNVLFDFLIITQDLTKAVHKLYEKSNIGEVSFPAFVYPMSILVYTIEICLHFLLFACFYIYLKGILQLITNMNPDTQKENKIRGLILIVMGFVVYNILKLLIKIDFKVTLDKLVLFVVFCMLVLMFAGGLYMADRRYNGNKMSSMYESLRDAPIDGNLSIFVDIFKSFVQFFPYAAMTTSYIYIVFTVLFGFYDLLFRNKHSKIRENKRKIFYTVILIIFMIFDFLS